MDPVIARAVYYDWHIQWSLRFKEYDCKVDCPYVAGVKHWKSISPFRVLDMNDGIDRTIYAWRALCRMLPVVLEK